MLIHNERGRYKFLPGIDPYSCGTIADGSHEIVHATFLDQPQWEEGFARADSYLQDAGLDRFALCGVELRCPHPYPMDGFIEFNNGYCELLRSWGLHVEGKNPIARTNVAPAHDPPSVTTMHGFSFVAPSSTNHTTFLISGAGELHRGDLDEAQIVRVGDISAEAMVEKASFVQGIMEQRMGDLGVSWTEVTTVDVYTIHLLDQTLSQVVLRGMGRASRHGFRWYCSRPPVVDIEFEMDIRGVRQEVYL